jgi:hypothetical protein
MTTMHGPRRSSPHDWASTVKRTSPLSSDDRMDLHREGRIHASFGRVAPRIRGAGLQPMRVNSGLITIKIETRYE